MRHYDLNPRGNLWAKDDSRFGKRLMERMGWRDGRGLGTNEDGISTSIQVSFRQVDDKRGVGANGLGADVALEGIRTYDQILRNLTEFNSATGPVSSPAASTMSEPPATEPERKHKRHRKHKRSSEPESGPVSHEADDVALLTLDANVQPTIDLELDPAEQPLPTAAAPSSCCSSPAPSTRSLSSSVSGSPPHSHAHSHSHSSTLTSLSERARRSRTLRFSKVVRGKDLSTRSARELLCVLGLAVYPTLSTPPAAAAAPADVPAIASATETDAPVAGDAKAAPEQTANNDVGACHLVSLVPTYSSGVSVADYFKRLAEKRKLARLGSPAPESTSAAEAQTGACAPAEAAAAVQAVDTAPAIDSEPSGDCAAPEHLVGGSGRRSRHKRRRAEEQVANVDSGLPVIVN